MKYVYRGPSDNYIAEGKTAVRDGDAVDLSEKAVKVATDRGHRFDKVKEESSVSRGKTKSSGEEESPGMNFQKEEVNEDE